jgi:protein-S-isoprenylcysteine O-methyltransferase Ste14
MQTDSRAENLSQVTKSRWQVRWNWFRARLPMIFLLGMLVFVRPSWHLFGLPFLLLGQGLRIWAVGYIHKDRSLATTGPYSLCRHPLYLGTFLSSIGVCVLVGSWPAAIIFTLVFGLVYVPTIRQEESYLAKAYGESYQAYAAKVPSFLPRWKPANVSEACAWQWSRLMANEEHLTWLALAMFFLAMFVKQRYS